MFCTKCGSKIKDHASFCTQCGHPATTGGVPVKGKKTPCPKKKRHIGKMMIPCICAACVAGAAALSIGPLQPVVQSFKQTIQSQTTKEEGSVSRMGDTEPYIYEVDGVVRIKADLNAPARDLYSGEKVGYNIRYANKGKRVFFNHDGTLYYLDLDKKSDAVAVQNNVDSFYVFKDGKAVVYLSGEELHYNNLKKDQLLAQGTRHFFVSSDEKNVLIDAYAMYIMPLKHPEKAGGLSRNLNKFVCYDDIVKPRNKDGDPLCFNMDKIYFTYTTDSSTTSRKYDLYETDVKGRDKKIAESVGAVEANTNGVYYSYTEKQEKQIWDFFVDDEKNTEISDDFESFYRSCMRSTSSKEMEYITLYNYKDGKEQLVADNLYKYKVYEDSVILDKYSDEKIPFSYIQPSNAFKEWTEYVSGIVHLPYTEEYKDKILGGYGIINDWEVYGIMIDKNVDGVCQYFKGTLDDLYAINDIEVFCDFEYDKGDFLAKSCSVRLSKQGNVAFLSSYDDYSYIIYNNNQVIDITRTDGICIFAGDDSYFLERAANSQKHYTLKKVENGEFATIAQNLVGDAEDICQVHGDEVVYITEEDGKSCLYSYDGNESILIDSGNHITY